MKLSAKVFGIKPAEGRFAPIDGLRGYMAFFVFLHHSCIWYFMVHGYGWGPPPSNLYSHFGPTSVSVFFMITSFLFFSKLLQARSGKVDWLKLYVGRALRIMPLYLVSIFILVFIVGVLSHFISHEPFGNIFWEILQWVVFIKANINGLVPTWLINAGVVWSLPYEWLCYFSLPFLALLLRIRTSIPVLLFALVGLAFFILIIVEFQSVGTLRWLNPFFTGIAAAIFTRNGKVKSLIEGPIVSFCIVLCLSMVVLLFPSADEIIPFLLLSVAFIGIACGNSVFGILTHKLSRTLGQVTYSIYLLHGIILFITFQWIVGFSRASRLTPLEHWSVIALCTIGMGLITSTTYSFIERSTLNKAPQVAEEIRKQLGRKKSLEAAGSSPII